MNNEITSYREINSENGTLNLDKIKLKILKSEFDSSWYYDEIGKELYFWNKKFINGNGSECLWLSEPLIYNICQYINIDCTNYNIIIRKNKLIKISEQKEI